MAVIKMPTAKSVQSKTALGFVYFLRCVDVVKIGFSQDPELRFGTLATMSPLQLELVGLHAGSRLDEAAIHERFADRRRHGEWFDWCPEIERVAESGFEPLPLDEKPSEVIVGAVLVPVIRAIFPHRTAIELQKRAGHSTRMCEYWLAQRHEFPAQALAALIVSDIGPQILEALRSSNANFVK